MLYVNSKELKNFIIEKGMMDFLNGEKNSIWIYGMPGIGKTQIFKRVCEKNKWNLFIVTMGTITSENFIGIPIPDKNYKNINWMGSLLEMENLKKYAVNFVGEDAPGILFLDDVHLSDMYMRKYLFELITNRKLGPIKLADNVMIFAAGNSIEDEAGAESIESAIISRFSVYYYTTDAEDWLNEYALENNVHPYVIGYISTNRDALLEKPKRDKAWACPRTWDMLSRKFYSLEKMNYDIKTHSKLWKAEIQACVGENFVNSVYNYIREIHHGIDKVLDMNTTNEEILKDQTLRNTLMYLFTTQKDKKDKGHKRIENFITYAIDELKDKTNNDLKIYITLLFKIYNNVQNKLMKGKVDKVINKIAKSYSVYKKIKKDEAMKIVTDIIIRKYGIKNNLMEELENE